MVMKVDPFFESSCVHFMLNTSGVRKTLANKNPSLSNQKTKQKQICEIYNLEIRD